jgi:hypothetical protein
MSNWRAWLTSALGDEVVALVIELGVDGDEDLKEVKQEEWQRCGLGDAEVDLLRQLLVQHMENREVSRRRAACAQQPTQGLPSSEHAASAF